MSGNFAIKGGGVEPLMANAILNFHFDFPHPSLRKKNDDNIKCSAANKEKCSKTFAQEVVRIFQSDLKQWRDECIKENENIAKGTTDPGVDCFDQ